MRSGSIAWRIGSGFTNCRGWAGLLRILGAGSPASRSSGRDCRAALFHRHGWAWCRRNAEIGDDSTIYQGVTRGALALSRHQAPSYFGQGVVVSCGRESARWVHCRRRREGRSNAVVLKEVPPGATVRRHSGPHRRRSTKKEDRRSSPLMRWGRTRKTRTPNAAVPRRSGARTGEDDRP